MGKTNMTFRDMVRNEREAYSQAERMVRRQHADAWEDIWGHAGNHADYMGAANPRNPTEGILYAICLGQQLEMQALQNRLDELESDGSG